MQEELLNRLKELGFNAYEAKVYLSLLKHHPATGYEVSKDSGVPQARAYDTLKALENRQIVIATGSKPVTYVPISAKELLSRCERTFKSSIDFLEENLPSISEQYDEPIHNLRSASLIFDRVVELIEQAKQEIFLEIWSEDLDRIREPLKKAHERGVNIQVVGYNNVELDFCFVYQHGLAQHIEDELGGRWVILSVDASEGIVGTVAQAVWTRNRGIVLIIKEVVTHDIFLIDVQDKLGDEVCGVYGKDFIKLRERILGTKYVFGS